MNDKLTKLTSELLELLVLKRYSFIEMLTSGVRLKAVEIRSIIKDYGVTLTKPPERAYDLINIIKIDSQSIEEYSIRMPLWSEEEGRSDLTLDFAVRKVEEQMLVKIYDIHVL